MNAPSRLSKSLIIASGAPEAFNTSEADAKIMSKPLTEDKEQVNVDNHCLQKTSNIADDQGDQMVDWDMFTTIDITKINMAYPDDE